MGKHVPPYDNANEAIVAEDNNVVPLCYFNQIRLHQGERYVYTLERHESAVVMAGGRATVTVDGEAFEALGQRDDVWQGDPEAVYATRGSQVEILCESEQADILVAGGVTDERHPPFAIRQADVDTIQYGSDDTKTHRKIKHILGQKNADRRGLLLVSELFTVGAGGWSGFPPHKHDMEDPPRETRYEEVYQFRFNPAHGFGAQFLYAQPSDYGPVYHVRTGSVIAIDKGYHPSVAAPGYEMYYFTMIVGAASKSLIQHFDPIHEYQVHTIPGIKDMIAKFK